MGFIITVLFTVFCMGIGVACLTACGTLALLGTLMFDTAISVWL